MSIAENKAIIHRYYEEVWNRCSLAAAKELIAPDIAFRGSLNVTTRGLEGFKEYVALVRTAFPDLHNTIEDLLAEGDKVVARLTYRGTHLGKLFGLAPTGKRVTCTGIAIFRIGGGKIVEGWVNGDTLGLPQQLGTAPYYEQDDRAEPRAG